MTTRPTRRKEKIRISISSSKLSSPHLACRPATTQSMIINELIDYHANHLLHVLWEKFDATIEDAISTVLLRNKEAVLQELNAAVGNGVEDTTRDRKADSAILQAIHRTLKSGSLVRDISQSIVEDDTVVNSLATLAKWHVDKALDDWKVTTDLTKTVAELSDGLEDVAKASKIQPRVYEKTVRPRHSHSRSCCREAHSHRTPCSQSSRKSETVSPRSPNHSSRELCQAELHSSHSKSRFHSREAHSSASRSSTE